jgi:hypothetical protein
MAAVSVSASPKYVDLSLRPLPPNCDISQWGVGADNQQPNNRPSEVNLSGFHSTMEPAPAMPGAIRHASV